MFWFALGGLFDCLGCTGRLTFVFGLIWVCGGGFLWFADWRVFMLWFTYIGMLDFLLFGCLGFQIVYFTCFYWLMVCLRWFGLDGCVVCVYGCLLCFWLFGVNCLCWGLIVLLNVVSLIVLIRWGCAVFFFYLLLGIAYLFDDDSLLVSFDCCLFVLFSYVCCDFGLCFVACWCFALCFCFM